MQDPTQQQVQNSPDTITKFPGLISQYNPLNLSPGALLRANDCSIRRENVIEDRRGYRLYGTLSNAAVQFLTYSNRVIAQNGTALSYDNGSGTFADYSSTYSAPTSRKMRFVEAASNLYATTNAGVKVFSDVAGTAGRLAGAPRALNATSALAGSTGFLASAFQCAYRSIIQRTDANSNVLNGYPSQRLWVTNGAGAARNVTLTIYLPAEAVANDVIQVYRTAQFSGTSTDSSGDEMGLVYQYQLTSTDISAGNIAFTDSITDSLRGASLYTNPSEQGILQANDRPPLSKDMCLYKTFMLYANTKTKHRLNVTLVGTTSLGYSTTGDTHTNTTLDNVANVTNLKIGWKVEGTNIPAGTTVSNIVGTTVTLSQAATGSASGQTVNFYTNQTIKLAGVTYNFGSSEIITGAGSPQIKVSITGVAATDIDLTARSFEYVCNRNDSNTLIYGYYVSGASETPGKLLFEERGLGAAAYTIQSSNTFIQSMLFPYPPVSPATNTQSTSTQDANVNRVYVAKSQQNEHVPATNYLPVGPNNKEILRIVSLRDSAIVIKEEGAYRITGDTFSNMVVTPIDLTVFCKAADSVAVLANQVFMLSNQGVVLISESGAQVISRDIEPSLLPIIAASNISTTSYGAAYESERSYFLSTLTVATDTVPTQTLVYNIFTRTWVRHTYAFVAAIVEPSTDKIYFAKPSDLSVYVERKSFDNTDFADPESSITITALSGTDTVNFTIGGATPAEGWIISQGGTDIAIDSLTYISGSYQATLTENFPGAWVTGAATIYPGVNMDIEFHSWRGPTGAATLKQVRAVGIITDDIPGNNYVSRLKPSFRSNFDPEPEVITMNVPAGGWGAAWGSSPWGGSGDPNGYPTWVPRNKQYCTRMNVGVKHAFAREHLVITGISYLYENAGDGIGR